MNVKKNARVTVLGYDDEDDEDEDDDDDDDDDDDQEWFSSPSCLVLPQMPVNSHWTQRQPSEPLYPTPGNGG